MYHLQETIFKYKDTYRLKVKKWKWKPKESWNSYTYIRQKRLLNKTVLKDKEGHYIVTKG